MQLSFTSNKFYSNTKFQHKILLTFYNPQIMLNHCAMYDCTRAKTQLSSWMQIKTFLDNINTQ